MGDFVTPEIQRLTLSGGQTIDIAKRLNHGETEDMYAKMLADRSRLRSVKILAYLIGWSLMRDGQPVPYAPGLPEQDRLDTLRALDHELAVEMHEAIEAHETSEERRRADAKKGKGGTPVSAAISPSPSSADGPSATSAPSA